MLRYDIKSYMTNCSFRDMIKNMPMGFFVQEFFNVAGQVNPLNLTDSEVGILSAALIMCPGKFNICLLLYFDKWLLVYNVKLKKNNVKS